MDVAKSWNAEERQHFITDMQSFIGNECSEIGEVLAQMSWTPDHVLKSSSMVQCPHDANHFVPEDALKRHAPVCQLRKRGLSPSEVNLELQNDDCFYEKSNIVGKVKLDEGLLNRIIWNHCMENRQVHGGHRPMPAGGREWEMVLTPQERMAVYDHCVATLTAAGTMPNVDRDETLTTDWERIIKKGLLEEGSQKPKSKMELLVLLRDQKRRRQTYRAKNVHVTRKSYSEIIREVISNQIEIMMPTDEAEDRKDDQTPQTSNEDMKSRGSRDRGDRRRSHSHHRSPSPRRERSRHRDRRDREMSSSRHRDRSDSCSPSRRAADGSRSRDSDRDSGEGGARLRDRVYHGDRDSGEGGMKPRDREYHDESSRVRVSDAHCESSRLGHTDMNDGSLSEEEGKAWRQHGVPEGGDQGEWDSDGRPATEHHRSRKKRSKDKKHKHKKHKKSRTDH